MADSRTCPSCSLPLPEPVAGECASCGRRLPANLTLLDDSATAASPPLGGLVDEYQARRRSPALAALFCGLIAVGLVVVTFMYPRNSATDDVSSGILVLGVVLFALMALIDLARSMRNARWRVLLYERGFVQVMRDARDAVLWTEDTSVITRTERAWILGKPAYTIRIASENGKRFEFDSKEFKQASELGQTIAREMMTRRRARALEDFRAGRQVTFGDVVVSRSGVYNGQELLQWNEMTVRETRPTRLTGRLLVLHKHGRRLPWHVIAETLTPNAPVLKDLLDEGLKLNDRESAAGTRRL